MHLCEGPQHDSLLIFQTSSSSSSSSFCSNNQWRILAKTTISSSNLWPTTIGSGKRGGRIKAVTEESSSFDGVADDYYAVLGLDHSFVKGEKTHFDLKSFSVHVGCKNCANVAPTVFEIEEDFGRARVHCQSGYSDIVQQAIESCPVDCIHWTSAAQVSLLEDEMRRVERVNVALMLAGMGTSADVFRTVR
ncbi:hypothetical protein ACHQM5_018382 [Ranunculus cassubicifolius]